MSVSVDNIVSLQVLVAPSAISPQGFGNMLFLGRSAVLPLYNPVRTYTALAGGVDVDFGPTTEEYKAAQVYFSQSPKPKQIKMGRQYLTAQAGSLRGGAASALLTDYTSIANGGFDIMINGVLRQIFGLDFTGAASLAAVATLIQTKLNAALAGTTCTWTGSSFVITSPTTGIASIVLFATAPTGGSSPTDQSSFLAMTATTGARTIAGIALESISAALGRTRAYDSDFYGVGIPFQASVQDNKDTMAWAEATKCKFWCTTNDINVLDPASTGDLMAYAATNSYKYTFVQYSQAPYAALSAGAREQVVDFSQPESTITLMFKQEPGIPVEPIKDSDLATIKAKKGTVYANVGGFNMIYNARMSNGDPSDQVVGLDWLGANVKYDVFNAMATEPTKIKQTDAGVQRLIDAEEQNTMRTAVLNGLLAPAKWNGNPVGLVKTGDYLKRGFYSYAQPVLSQGSADRAARLAPAITIIATGAGALEGANITIIFQR